MDHLPDGNLAVSLPRFAECKDIALSGFKVVLMSKRWILPETLVLLEPSDAVLLDRQLDDSAASHG